MRLWKLTVMVSAFVAQSVSGCRCEPEDLNDLKPKVAATPNPVDFLIRRVNSDTTVTLSVLNQGTSTLSVSAMRVEPASAPFRVELPSTISFPFTVPEATAQEVTLVFRPTARGPANAELVIESDDKETPAYRVPLVGVGGGPRIQVLPETLSFDLVNQGVAAERTLQISNIGLDTLNVTEVSIENAATSGFKLAPMNNFGSGQVAPGDSVLVRVIMEPLVTGTATDTLHVLSDAQDTPDKTVPINAAANLGPAVVLVEKVTRQADYQTDLYLDVVLDASETMDLEMDTIVSRSWRMLDRPLGSQAILDTTGGPDTERRIFIDTVGLYRVQLTATDSRGAVGTAEATVRAIRDLALRLTWEPGPNSPCRNASMPENQCGKTDVDLHLVAPTGMVGAYFTGCADTPGCSATCRPTVAGTQCRSQGLDCSYANRNPDWGTLGNVDDDPRLDIDDAYGYGPENISMNNPVDGDFQIQVHFCNDRLNTEGAVAKVEVFFRGVPADPPILGPVTLPAEGSVWLAGIVNHNAARSPKFILTGFASPVVVDGAANLCTQ